MNENKQPIKYNFRRFLASSMALAMTVSSMPVTANAFETKDTDLENSQVEHLSTQNDDKQLDQKEEITTATLSTELSYEDFRKEFFKEAKKTEKKPISNHSNQILTPQEEAPLPTEQRVFPDAPLVENTENTPYTGNTITNETSAITEEQDEGYGFESGETSQRDFYVASGTGDTGDSGYASKSGNLVAQGEHCNIWYVNVGSSSSGTFLTDSYQTDTDTKYSYTDEAALAIAKRCDLIYNAMVTDLGIVHKENIITTSYGNMPTFGDVDSDGRVNLVMYDIDADGGSNSYTGGYFWSGNYYNSYKETEHTPIDAVHMDIGFSQGWGTNQDAGVSEGFYGTFAHELQHLLYHMYIGAYLPSSINDLWFNESLSGVPDIFYATGALADQNLSSSRISSGVKNAYTSSSYSDFVNFSGLKNYGMGYMFSAFMMDFDETYFKTVYESFEDGLTKKGDEIDFSATVTSYADKDVADIVGTALKELPSLSDIDGFSDLENEKAFEYVYTAFMECFASGGGSVIDGDNSSLTYELWKNEYSTIWSVRSGNPYSIGVEGSYMTGATLDFDTISSGSDENITLKGYGTTAAEGATHEMFYLLDMSSYDSDIADTIEITVTSSDNIKAYVAFYDKGNTQYTAVNGGYATNGSYVGSNDHADLYPLTLGESNTITVPDGEYGELQAYLFVTTFYDDADATVNYQWTTEAIGISEATVTIASADLVYTGSEITPDVTVELESNTLDKDTDYTVAYSNNTNASTDTDTATVSITGIGKYSGTIEETFEIIQADISSASISDIDSQEYTGTEIKPTLEVTLEEYTLTEDTDYTVEYSDNTEVGTATVTITGIGNFKDTQEKTFEITAKSITDATVSADPVSYAWTGETITPDISVVLGETVLTKDSEYTVAYSNNTDVGTVTVTATGTGNYQETATGTFEITKPSIESATVTLEYEATKYTGTALEPTLAVKLGDVTLTKGTDYTVVYSDNTNASTATVTIEGTGNYSGKIEKTFEITPADLSTATVVVDDSDLTYDGTELTPTVTVKMGEISLDPETDYTLSYSDNMNASASAKVTVTGMGNYEGSFDGTFTIGKATYSDGTTAAGSAKFGATSSIDLSAWFENVDGLALAKDDSGEDKIVTDDTESILYDTVSLDGDYQLAYTFADTDTNAGGVATVTLTFSSTNYEDFDVVVTLTVTALGVPVITVSPFAKIYDGTAVTPEDLSAVAKIDSTDITGTWTFTDTIIVIQDAAIYSVTLLFTPEDSDSYATAETIVSITIESATITDNTKKSQSETKVSGKTNYSPTVPTGETVDSTDITVNYWSDSNNSYSDTSIPVFTEAGNHQVKYQLSALNHQTIEGVISYTLIDTSSNVTTYTISFASGDGTGSMDEVTEVSGEYTL